MANKVRVGSRYEYHPVLFDRLEPPAALEVKDGQVVTVIDLYGCPKANTMGMCYISLDGTKEGFAGMVCTNSLRSVRTPRQRLLDEIERLKSEVRVMDEKEGRNALFAI